MPDTLQKYFLKNKKLVEAEIKKSVPPKITKKWVARHFSENSDFDLKSLQKEYSDPVWDLLNRGGKRWRPMLLLLSCRSLNGSSKLALRFTPLPELIHNGTLIADDIEDSALLRRNKKSLHLIYGTDTAINTSSMIYFSGLKVVSDNSSHFSSKQLNKIYELYSQQLLAVSFGQALDIRWHKSPVIPTEKQYFRMVSLKTGALARLAAELGAIIANASSKQQEVLGAFAESFGVAFQIRDDILSLKSSHEWGKDFAEDISEGKKTLILIRALKKLPSAKKKKLLRIISLKTKNKNLLRQALDIINSTDAIDYSKKQADSLLDKTWRKLDSSLPETSSKKLLFEMLQYAVSRKI